MKSGKNVRQVAINLVSNLAPTLTWGIHRASINNTIPSDKPHQLYLAFLVIYEADTDK